MPTHHDINYLELPARDITVLKAFFEKAFGWAFEDYGPEYCAVTNQNMDLGFYQAPLSSTTENGACLVVFYSEDLEQSQQKVVACGGKMVKATFDFPGGRRFHFADPCGNEYAVWSDKGL